MGPMELKPGAKFRSTTCTTEVVVVKGSGDHDIRCGGQPLVPAADAGEPTGTPAAPHDTGSLMGKRYVAEEAGIELLVTKAGAGSLSLGDEPLPLKDAKPLPASD